ncbi:MAG TPA: branched-chain amino acid ABC transporter permease [Marmoricola sp.]|jgi:branched-chain amino acid transport system permease protein|nr:branched-chain amino acid ABC transporter permease [Marmoricola sp.]
MLDMIQAFWHDGVGPFALSFVLAAIGLNVHYGYTGLLNFGQAAFVAVGAYGMGVMVQSFDLPLVVGLAVGIIASILLAIVLGVPTLRLRADYLAIATIAAAEILRLMFSATFKEYFHARDGVTAFTAGFRQLNPYPTSMRNFLTFSRNDLWVMTVGWILVALVCVLIWLLMRAPWGRVLKGIREDEEAVRSLGKNVYSYKMQALALGGAIGATGGFIGGLGLASVQPDSFNTDFTFIAFTMLVLGGAARVLGPVVGAVLFWGVLSALGVGLGKLVQQGLIPESMMSADQVSNVRFMLVGIVLMLLMIYRPQGIFGDKKEIALDAR